MVFYIYKMKGINYVGSTIDIKQRCWKHNDKCWNENSNAYNSLLYRYIREKNIKIELEILGVYKRECNNRIRLLVEQYYINLHDSVNNGFNNINAFTNRKKYYEENKDKINKQRKKHYEENKEKINNRNKKYQEENKDKINKQRKKHYEENKEKINNIKNKRYKENKEYREKIKQKRNKYYQENKEKISQKGKIKINCCLCGSLVRKSDIKRHQKTKRCKSLSKVY